MKTFMAFAAVAAVALLPTAASACGCCDHHQEHASAQRTAAVGEPLGPGEVRVRIPIAGMHCSDCVARVESALADLAGVKRADASLRDRAVVVVLDQSKTKTSQLVEAIDALGFKAGTPIPD